jgi:hypothetical protein
MRSLRVGRGSTAAMLLTSLSLCAALLGPSAAGGAILDCSPEQNFTLTIDNTYFPLPVRQTWVYSGKEQGQTIGLQIEVLSKTETFYKDTDPVTTRVVVETEWEDDGDGRIERGER